MIYHATLGLHEWLPLIVLVAAALSVATVAAGVARVRARASTLLGFAQPPPPEIASAFVEEGRNLGLPSPPIAYLDVPAPLCFALAGRPATIVLSRGFLVGLDPLDVRLVARHELLHVRYRHPRSALFWHLAFAALLLPGFGSLERFLGFRRELRANVEAAARDPERYADLLTRRARQHQALCDEGRSPQRSPFPLAMPALASAILMGLIASHIQVVHEIGYLSTHHC